jgi:methylenetetrahydrofolate dehydrogenase (NADP+)/methenyltetrahydrofolate cyclohydrolase
MSGSLLDGNRVAAALRASIKLEISELSKQEARIPSLAVVLVGDDPASSVYVKNKQIACENVGMQSFSYELAKSVSEKELLILLNQLNNDTNIDGILVQLPLPPHIHTNKIINAISPEKDVDGFHPINMGALSLGNPRLRPCTPFGIIQLLKYYQINLKGMDATVVGASNIVGRPMAFELLNQKATITICHRNTQNLQQKIEEATLLVIATGVKDIIPIEWLKSKHIVVDVGIHRLPNGKLRGDINFERAKNIVNWITPVPGGVGPMTITALLQNTLHAYYSREINE